LVHSSSWIDVFDASALTEGKPSRAAVEGLTVLVVQSAGEYFAIGNQCTHQGAGLDRGVIKMAGSVKTVTCPAHGSMFNLETGKPMRPPATKPVPVYEVKVENGRVFVRPRAET
jgi:nitrite reductase/ring-hydroxylating ferredoxin subunit